MRNFGKMLFLAAALACVALAAAEPSKVKVGFYIDSGSLGCGVLYWARILHFSPQLEVTLINGKDIRDGKLKDLDLLMVPGGSSSKQCKAMGEEGMAEVRRYVADGGAYLGVCAGYHCALRGTERIGLFTYRRRENGYGGLAALRVEITENAAKLLDIPKGNYNVRYSHGPIVRSAPDTSPAPGGVAAKTEVLGFYRGTVSPAGQAGINFFGAPAVLFGTYGKGKVVATSCHPESRTASWPIALGCVYAATGVKPTPQLPVKVYIHGPDMGHGGTEIILGNARPLPAAQGQPQKVRDIDDIHLSLILLQEFQFSPQAFFFPRHQLNRNALHMEPPIIEKIYD